MLISSSKATSNGLISKIDYGESWCNTMNLQQNYCDCNESQSPWIVLCSSLQENYPRARRCLDVYCVAQPQVEPGDEQSIHILNELYYGTRPSVYFKHLQTLQKTLASLDRFQDVSTCLKSIIVSLCQHLSRGFPCFYQLPGCWHCWSQSLKRSDVEILLCRFATYSYDLLFMIYIYMNTKCDGQRSLRCVILCAYWFKGSSDASTCNLWIFVTVTSKNGFWVPSQTSCFRSPHNICSTDFTIGLGFGAYNPECRDPIPCCCDHHVPFAGKCAACQSMFYLLGVGRGKSRLHEKIVSFHAMLVDSHREQVLPYFAALMSDNQHGLNVFDIVIF